MIRFVLPLILLLLSSAVALAQTPYYQGKTITFIVGSGAGTASPKAPGSRNNDATGRQVKAVVNDLVP